MTRPRSRSTICWSYAAALLCWAQSTGQVHAQQTGSPASDPAAHAVFFHVLLAIAVVLTASYWVGRAFARIGQPAVMGEMFAGIMLGPSLLGRWAPQLADFVFPNAITGQLRVLAQLGVVLYLFMIGLELDLRQLQSRARAAITISAAGIVLPLSLGAAITPIIHATLAPSGVSLLVFGAFLSVSLAVTAFPVLARIVMERGIERSPLGVMALTCAAADDLAAWCLLSVVVSLARAQQSGLVTFGLASLYLALMLGLVRPWIRALTKRQEQASELSRGTLATMLVGLLLSAMATEWIGVHALFGAFFFGALVPAESRLARQLTAKLEQVVGVLLLPIFFAITGLRTQLGFVEGAQSWLLCLLIVLVAFVGKLGGTSLAARVTGMDWRNAVQLGALMNTRGLMELIVLNVGLELGIISAPLFAMMVLMALITTCAAAPLLNWLAPAQSGSQSVSAAGVGSRLFDVQ